MSKPTMSKKRLLEILTQALDEWTWDQDNYFLTDRDKAEPIIREALDLYYAKRGKK